MKPFERTGLSEEVSPTDNGTAGDDWNGALRAAVAHSPNIDIGQRLLRCPSF
jgi:hypothetical protein